MATWHLDKPPVKVDANFQQLISGVAQITNEKLHKTIETGNPGFKNSTCFDTINACVS
jgi:hypothetical protein